MSGTAPAEYAITGSATNPQCFPGQVYDPETGFYYLRNRYYDPRTGRFLQRDPVWDPHNSGHPYLFHAILVANQQLGDDYPRLEEWIRRVAAAPMKPAIG